MSRLPSGVVQFFEPLSSKRREIENVLIAFFKSKGYKEIITPSFSYETEISEGLFEPLKSRLFKFIDSTTSETLILRADITMQVMQAVLMGDLEMPVRVCYADNVYRDIKEESPMAMREFKQAGIEVIGIPDISGDIEVLQLLLEGCSLIGIKEMIIRISDTQIIEELLKKYNLNNNRQVKQVMEKKNIDLLSKMEGVPLGFIEEIKKLIELSGYIENEPRELAKISPALLEVCKVIHRQHPQTGVFIDLFYTEYPTYHRGVTFGVFSKEEEIAIGGRYGKITESFGRYIPATGFAINIDKLVYFTNERVL